MKKGERKKKKRGGGGGEREKKEKKKREKEEEEEEEEEKPVWERYKYSDMTNYLQNTTDYSDKLLIKWISGSLWKWWLSTLW